MLNIALLLERRREGTGNGRRKRKKRPAIPDHAIGCSGFVRVKSEPRVPLLLLKDGRDLREIELSRLSL